MPVYKCFWIIVMCVLFQPFSLRSHLYVERDTIEYLHTGVFRLNMFSVVCVGKSNAFGAHGYLF